MLYPPSSTFSHRPLNPHLPFQTPSLWPTITPRALDLRSLFCGGASLGILTKTSNTATQRQRTWHWLKCLKVASNSHRVSVSMLVFGMSFSLSNMCSLQTLWSRPSGKSRFMNLIPPIRPTTASSMMTWSYGWERQPFPTSRSSTGS